jgi:hypothetical protein
MNCNTAIEKQTNTPSNAPDSGVYVLPDGRVQVIFDMDAGGFSYFPGHLFELVASINGGVVCDDTRSSLNFLLVLFKNMLPSETQAVKGYENRREP